MLRTVGAAPRRAGMPAHRACGVALLLAGLAAACLAGCGAPGAPAALPGLTACERVGAVLSDGPDPGADPIGYAEAQILPLRSVHPSNAALRGDLDALSAAYARYFRTDGSHSAELLVARAERRLDRVCPGVTQ